MQEIISCLTTLQAHYTTLQAHKARKDGELFYLRPKSMKIPYSIVLKCYNDKIHNGSFDLHMQAMQP